MPRANARLSEVETEMERDCVAAHGVAEFTKERFMECSDMFPCTVCRRCGMLAVANPKEHMMACARCANTTDFAQVQIPYASKLFLQELESMCITSRLITEGELKPMDKHYSNHMETLAEDGEGEDDQEYEYDDGAWSEHGEDGEVEA